MTRRKMHGGLYTETKRIVGGEVKQVTCCCDDPGAGPRDCANVKRKRSPCRCDCHRGKSGPGKVA